MSPSSLPYKQMKQYLACLGLACVWGTHFTPPSFLAVAASATMLDPMMLDPLLLLISEPAAPFLCANFSLILSTKGSGGGGTRPLSPNADDLTLAGVPMSRCGTEPLASEPARPFLRASFSLILSTRGSRDGSRPLSPMTDDLTLPGVLMSRCGKELLPGKGASLSAPAERSRGVVWPLRASTGTCGDPGGSGDS